MMYYGVTDVVTFTLGTIAIVLLPGPNSLYVMNIAAERGITAGFRGAAGIFLGDLVLMFLSAMGAASLLKAIPWAFAALKYAGAAYLIFLGWSLCRSAWHKWQDIAPKTVISYSRHQPLRVALMISLLNPKAILFYVSFFIQFVAPDYPYPALSFLILGSIVQISSMVYLSILIFGGRYLALYLQRRRYVAVGATGAVGGLFISFGVKLAAFGLR